MCKLRAKSPSRGNTLVRIATDLRRERQPPRYTVQISLVCVASLEVHGLEPRPHAASRVALIGDARVDLLDPPTTRQARVRSQGEARVAGHAARVPAQDLAVKYNRQSARRSTRAGKSQSLFHQSLGASCNRRQRSSCTRERPSIAPHYSQQSPAPVHMGGEQSGYTCSIEDPRPTNRRTRLGDTDMTDQD